MDVLPKRMNKFSLTVQPEKTRLVHFSPPEGNDSALLDQRPSEPQTFDFLGFTHCWDQTRQGTQAIKRKTAKTRFRHALHAA
jgi:hypothetical protein